MINYRDDDFMINTMQFSINENKDMPDNEQAIYEQGKMKLHLHNLKI